MTTRLADELRATWSRQSDVGFLLFPLVGPVAWLIAGRPPRRPRLTRQPPRPRGPDDDPDFLKDL